MRLPGDVARLVGGEESRERGDLLGTAQPTHGLALDERLFHLRNGFARCLRTVFDPLLQRRRFDGAGTDRIGSDALPNEVGGNRLGETDDRGFCSTIGISIRDPADLRHSG